MILTDKYGNTRNTELIYSIEARINTPSLNIYSKWWFVWKKYKSTSAVLQAFEYYKKNEQGGRFSSDGGKTWHEHVWQYRITHCYYEF